MESFAKQAASLHSLVAKLLLLPFMLGVDTSHGGLGAVLSQKPNGKNGKVLVLLQLLVSYPRFQRKLTSTSSLGFILSQEHIHTGNFICTGSHTALFTAREWRTSHSTEGHEKYD